MAWLLKNICFHIVKVMLRRTNIEDNFLLLWQIKKLATICFVKTCPRTLIHDSNFDETMLRYKSFRFTSPLLPVQIMVKWSRDEIH